MNKKIIPSKEFQEKFAKSKVEAYLQTQGGTMQNKNMEKKKLQDAMNELKQLFIDNGVKFKTFEKDENKKENTSWMVDTTFMIDKNHLDRYDVIALVKDYFKDKCIENGYCEIGPITLVWTDVSLYDNEHPKPTYK